MIKEIRANAASNGLTFKQSNTRLNGQYTWEIINRETGQVLVSMMTLNSAYEDYRAGYFDTLKM